MKVFKNILRVFLLLLLCAILLFWYRDSTAFKRAEVKAELITKSLTIGLSADEVKSQLKELGIEYHYDNEQNMFIGIKRDVSRKFPVAISLAVSVQMDDNNSLKDVIVKEAYTGP